MKGFRSKALLCIISSLWVSMATAAQLPSAASTVAPATVSMRVALQRATQHPHLLPDARFIGALGIVESFPAAQSDVVPMTEFRNGVWSVIYQGHELGSLPQYPDFTDAMALLRRAVKGRLEALRVAKRSVTQDQTASQASALDERGLFAALETMNARYSQGGLSTGDLKLAAEAVTRLVYLEDDYLGTADGLYAKAMALLALAETVDDTSMPKEEALLASSMGYEGAGWAQMKQLPADDSWRLFKEHDDVGLEHEATVNPDDPDSNYLWLRRLADLNRVQEWVAVMKRRYPSTTPPVSVYDTESRMQNLETAENASATVPLLVLIALPGSEHVDLPSKPDTVHDPAGVLRYFDQGIPYIGNVIKGPYLTADEAVAYYRGFLDTGVSGLGVYYISRLADHDSAKAYDDLLSKASGVNGQALYTWYDTWCHVNQGDLTLQGLMSNMSAVKGIHPFAYSSFWSTVSGRLGGDDATAHAAAWQLASLYDTRTTQRQVFTDTLHWINATPEFEQAAQSMADQESDQRPYMKLKVAGYNDDLKFLFKAAKDKHLDKRTRVLALESIRDSREAPDQVRAAYKSILADYPDYSFAYASYVHFLDSNKDYAEIERIAPAWLSIDTQDATGFEYWDASIAAADAELNLGDVDKAWSTISSVLFEPNHDPSSKPVIANYYGKLLSESVTVALAKGDYAEAEELAGVVAARYPDCFECQEPTLRVYWKQKRYADAAQYLATWPHPIPPWQWAHNFAYVFAQAFKADTQGGADAFAAMEHTKLTGGSVVLGYLVTGVNYTQPDLAFAMRHAVPLPPRMPESLPDVLEDYKYLRAAKGIEVARAWALPRLQAIDKYGTDPNSLAVKALVTYQSGVYDLFWDVVPNPDASSSPSMIWLYRASIHTQRPVETPQQLALLKQHFAKAGDGWYDLLGKYLMGYARAEDIVDRPLDMRAISEASYYFALRALSEHRYTDAIDWLEVDFDTGRTDNGEYWWGEALRSHWNLEYEAMPVMDRKGALYEDKH